MTRLPRKERAKANGFGSEEANSLRKQRAAPTQKPLEPVTREHHRRYKLSWDE